MKSSMKNVLQETRFAFLFRISRDESAYSLCLGRILGRLGAVLEHRSCFGLFIFDL